ISAPDSGISFPENNKAYNNSNNAIAQIEGTSTDDKSGIPNGGVELWIRCLGPAGELDWPTTYWNGSAWQNNPSGPIWLPATLVGSPGDLSRPWTYSAPDFTGKDGYRFRTQSRARDCANNIESPTIENYFEYDITRPTSAITSPVDGAEISKWSEIKGEARDKYPGSKLDIVQLLIIDRGTDNDGDYYYWTGSSWTTTLTYVTASWAVTPTTGTCYWKYTPPGPENLTSGYYYRVISRAKDKASNYDSVLSTATIKYDLSTPQSKITDIVDYRSGEDSTHTDRLMEIQGEAWAGVQITDVEVLIYDSQQNAYWDGSEWVAGETWKPVQSTNKEFWRYTNVPSLFKDGSAEFRGDSGSYIKSRAKTATKTETGSPARTPYIKRGSWPRSYILTPEHGTYANDIDYIYARATYGAASDSAKFDPP
ncbi:MAG: hypothetical protein QME68_08500, partial [Elusimicrobiota bacterium]|nr:hypothetical protein [Elusimicrobiota bacterium]